MGIIRATSEWADREEAVKKRLRSYRILVSRHEACQDLLDRLFPRLTSGFTPDRVMAQSGNTNEDKVIKKIDLETRMKNSLEEMKTEAEAISAWIMDLPPEEYVVLFRRYILNEHMDKISEASNISIATCWRVHRRAIRRLAEKLIVKDS